MSSRGIIGGPIPFKQDEVPEYRDSQDTYYPVGNSQSVDIISGCRVGKQCDILLLGCGDVRNILHTLDVLSKDKKSKFKGQILSIHLNDIEEGILARDYIMIHLIRSIDPGNPEDLKFVWAVWYDVIMTEQHMQRLKYFMEHLLQEKEGTSEMYFGNDVSKNKLKEAIKLWLNVKLTARDTLEKRTAFMKTDYKVNFPHAAVNRISSKLLYQYEDFYHSSTLKQRYKEEIRDYVMLGITRVNRGFSSSEKQIDTCQANMTFFRPGSEKWQVQDNSCPYMCFDPGLEIERYDGVNTTMSSLCLEILKRWVEGFQRLVGYGCQIKIFFWLGEATVVAENDLPGDLNFDFIDTSNISDRVGLFPLLIDLQRRLKRNNGLMRTEIYHWHHASNRVEEFLRMCLDIPLLMYPTVLGLHLAEELTLGREQVLEDGTFVGIGKLTLRWKVARENDKLTLSSNDGVSLALAELNHPKYHQGPVYVQVGKLEASKFSVKARDILRTRLDSIANNIDDSDLTVTSNNGSHAIHEFEDHYKITIVTEPELLKEGSVGMTHVDEDTNVVVLRNVTNGRTTFSKTLSFSCGISINSSKIILSRKRGIVECSFFKDYDTTVGERVLPWKLLKTHDLSSLPDHPQSEFAINQLHLNLYCIYPKDELKKQFAGPPPYQLEGLMRYLLKTAPMRNGIPCLVWPGVEQDKNVLMLEGWKIFENQATTFITWYDIERGQRLVKQGKASQLEFLELCSQSSGGIAQEVAEQLVEGIELLKKVMKLNSYRMKQELPKNRRWKIKTFLRARYQYKDFQSLCWELRNGNDKSVREQTMSKCSLSGNDISSALQDLGVQQEEMKTFTASTTSTSGTPFASDIPCTVNEILCIGCAKTKECRKCTGCLKAYYCSKECQRKDWPCHKLKCRKY